MRGRKPIPTHIKEARGNPGKRKLNKNEPKADAVVPICPSFFDDEAKREWNRMVLLLLETRIMTELDIPALILYCNAYSRWMNAERNLRQYGEVILSPDKKYPVQSPYLAIANKAQEQMIKLIIEFGMTPSSRSRVQVKPYLGPSSLDLFVAGRDSPDDEDGLESDPLKAAIEEQKAILREERERAADKARFFERRPNPAQGHL